VQPPKSEICVICGARRADTVDHVPPKGLFKGVLNAQLRTVPACRVCNNGASSDDEDLRFFISVQIGKQNPASTILWDEGAHKSILRKTKLRESFVATARDIQVHGDDGAVATRIAINIPVQTYQRVFERTTRGLYFFHSGRILPPSVEVSVTMLAGTPNLETKEISMLHTESIREGACVYRYGIVPEDVNVSLWIYEFHQAHWVMVTTNQPT
jgi:hypothetical protein